MKLGRPPTSSIPIGTKVGQWTITKQTRKGKGANTREAYACVCTCGAKQVLRKSVLQSGKGLECRACASKRVRLKHGGWGKSFTTEWRIWCGMKQRCLNPNHDAYHYYGGRGIKVCERWLESFENFYADMGPRPPMLTLERRNNEGDYAPDNCYWATRTEQNSNQRTNHLVTVDGVTQTVAAWAHKLGTKPAVLYNRIHQYGWDEVAACTTPVRAYRSKS